MKKFYLVLFSVLLSGNIFSQAWQWAIKAEGVENDYANGVEVDNSGNSYVTGTFYDSISFGSASLVNHDTWSVYIARYNSNGNLDWVKIALSDSVIVYSDIHLDASGNIFLSGQFNDTATFGGANPINLVSSGSTDIFLAKYSNTGDVIWAKSFGGVGVDYSGGVSSDSRGNLYLTGDFHITSFPYSSSKIFLAKYDSLGNVSWLKTENNFGNSHFGNSIKSDSSGNSYITGEFFDTIIFNGSDSIVAGNIESNTFIAKFDSSGNFIWGQKAGAASGYCGCKAIDIDVAGNSYITGLYHGTISLGPFSITGTSGLGYDVFVAKCDAGGNFEWVNQSTGAGTPYCICTDNFGNVFVGGTFLQPISFGINSLNSVGNNDVFIASLNSAGNYLWAVSCGGIQNDFIKSIKSNSNEIYLAGYYADTIHFGNLLSLANSSSTKSDIFLAKLNTVTGIEELAGNEFNLTIFPNPANDYFTIDMRNCLSNARLVIYDETGRIISSEKKSEFKKIKIDGSVFIPGVYWIRVYSDNFDETKKLVITK